MEGEIKGRKRTEEEGEERKGREEEKGKGDLHGIIIPLTLAFGNHENHKAKNNQDTSYHTQHNRDDKENIRASTFFSCGDGGKTQKTKNETEG